MNLQTGKRLLNVGGGDKTVPIPPEYHGWEHLLLDIDPKGNPDLVCDARELLSQKADSYDAIYCSHNLEHYYRHDVARVLRGFAHVLKPDGFAEIRVPDMNQVFREIMEKNLDIDDVLYQSNVGPILVSDVIYGYQVEIQESGNDFYAHKTGFTVTSLQKALFENGFSFIYTAIGPYEIKAYAFQHAPSVEIATLLKLY